MAMGLPSQVSSLLAVSVIFNKSRSDSRPTVPLLEPLQLPS
jgi:hypothetical protein